MTTTSEDRLEMLSARDRFSRAKFIGRIKKKKTDVATLPTTTFGSYGLNGENVKMNCIFVRKGWSECILHL